MAHIQTQEEIALRFLSMVCLSALLALSTSAATYNAFNDFSSSNPSGVWAYGTAVQGFSDIAASFVLMPTYDGACVSGQAACWSAGTASVAHPNSTFSSGTVNFVDGYLNLHPSAGLDWSILRFTAPSAGVYNYAGMAIDDDVLGGSGVVLRLIGPGIDTSTPLGAVFAPQPVIGSVALAAGDRIYLMVGAGQEYTFDSVGMQLTVSDGVQGEVPEPSTYALAAAGLAALWARRRLRA